MPQRRLAKEIRAARAYADLSREQLGEGIDLSADTIGRYERGEWDKPPIAPVLKAIAETCDIPAAYLAAGFLAPEPSTRFADAARREARRRGAHPESEPEAPPDEDAGNGAQ